MRTVLSPALAPVESTAAVRVAGFTLPLATKPASGPELGVVRLTGEPVVCWAPVDWALNWPNVVLMAPIAGKLVDLAVRAVRLVAAAEGLATVGSMLALPSSPSTRRLRSDPALPRATLRMVSVALDVPTPDGLAPAGPAPTTAPNRAVSVAAAAIILVRRMWLLPTSARKSFKGHFRRRGRRAPWPRGVIWGTRFD